MEIIIALVVIVFVGALVYFNRSAQSLDINNDGKVDLTDAKVAVDNAVNGVKDVADVNKDGTVNLSDIKAAGEKATSGVKKAAVKAKTAAKKTTTRGRKPKAQPKV